ncbi:MULTISPECIES: PaaI family thioesterase [Heyndrickxia]|mgnify:FL=1|uniref:PaaI family thioesterase n=1 Tax=Heyndrickxia TaxID=2837504 RepID=UPI001B116447|nr:PaaI family thioesterase [Heyndrickxia oleronia]GIN37657.1 hypothetical protein J19TS1_06060 [Heyndrickxia oleronia]
MKENLLALFNECLQNANEDDLKVMYQLLNGVKRKQEKVNYTFIDGILHMDRDISDQKCEITIPISALTENSLQIVHGGVTATILDTAMGTLANSLLPTGYGAVTSNLSIYYIAPGIGESLRASAEVIHKGTKTLVIEGSVHRNDGKKIAHCSGTFFIIKK